MIYRIEPGMVHVNDALSRQERRARRRLRPRPTESDDEPQRTEVDEGRDEDQARLDLVA